MKRLLLLILVGVAATVFSMDELPITVKDFTRGLVTARSDVHLELGEAEICHNVDLTRFPRSIAPRLGYDSIISIPGIDSFLHNGLYAVNFQSGKKELILIADDGDEDYAQVWVSKDNVLQFGTKDSFVIHVDTQQIFEDLEGVAYYEDICWMDEDDSTDILAAIAEVLNERETYTIAIDSVEFMATFALSGGDSTSAKFRITIDTGLSATPFDSSFRVDTVAGWTVGEVVDTFVAWLNAGAGDILTASKVGDDIYFECDSAYLSLDVTGFTGTWIDGGQKPDYLIWWERGFDITAGAIGETRDSVWVGFYLYGPDECNLLVGSYVSAVTNAAQLAWAEGIETQFAASACDTFNSVSVIAYPEWGSPGDNFHHKYVQVDNNRYQSIDSLQVRAAYGIYCSIWENYTFYNPPGSVWVGIRVVPWEDADWRDYCRAIGMWADSNTTRQQIVDSIVDDFNNSACFGAGTAAEFGDGDSLGIVEDTVGGGLIVFINQGTRLDRDWHRFRAAAGTGPGTDTIASRFPATGVPQYAQFNDRVYIANGVAKSLMYDGKRTTLYPLSAPGEIRVLPLTVTSEMEGIYRYMLRYVDVAGSEGFGYLSGKVVVQNQQVLLSGFPERQLSYAGDTLQDSVRYQIWRTTGDVGAIDGNDSIWNTGYIVDVDSSDDLTTISLIDTVGDSLLRTKTGVPLLQSRIIHSDLEDGNPMTVAPGTVQWLASDSLENAESDSGLWQGVQNDYDIVAGWSWKCVFLDTISGQISDAGGALNHAPATISTYAVSRRNMEKVTLCVPKSYDPHHVCLLYRGPVLAGRIDTVTLSEELDITIKYLRDLFVPAYYLLDEVDPGGEYTDSSSYPDLLIRDPYQKNAAPSALVDLTIDNNQLVATDGSRIYISNPIDSGVEFYILNQVFVNPDDGERITGIWSARGYLTVAKSGSQYNTYEVIDDQGNVGRKASEKATEYGLIATNAHVAAPEGHYVLSADGVRLQREGEYQERDLDQNLVSGPLNNFAALGIQALEQAFACYLDYNKYVLSIPGVDTAFVLNKVAKPEGGYRYGWSTWDIVPIGAASYNAAPVYHATPSDTTYFILRNDPNVYRYGTSNKDNNTDIAWAWQSGVLNDPSTMKLMPTEVDLMVESSDSTQDILTVTMIDLKDSSSSFTVSRVDTSRMLRYELAPVNANEGWKVRITSTGDIQESDTKIQKIDVDLVVKERY